MTVTTAGDDVTSERDDSAKVSSEGGRIQERHVPPVLDAAPRGTKTLVQRIPFRKFGALLILWVMFLVSQAQKSAYPRCTWEYMTVWGGQVAVLLLVGGWQIAHQVRKARRNDEDLDPEMRVILTQGSLSGGKALMRHATYTWPSLVIFVSSLIVTYAGQPELPLTFNICLWIASPRPVISRSNSHVQDSLVQLAKALDFYREIERSKPGQSNFFIFPASRAD